MKNGLKIISFGICILSLGWVVWQLDFMPLLDITKQRPGYVLQIFSMGIGMYVLVGLLPMFGWKLLMEFFSNQKIDVSQILSVYLKANIAKYLPGNVFHYAGRNMLGKELGWSQEHMAMSSFLEVIQSMIITFLIVLTFLTFSVTTNQYDFSLNSSFLQKITIFIGIVIMIGILVFVIFRNRIMSYLSQKKALLIQGLKRFKSLEFIFLMYNVYVINLSGFVLSGILFYFLYNGFAVNPLEMKDFFEINVLITITGLSGIITPGVPAGLGIKEYTTLVALGKFGYPTASLALALLANRIVSIAGDFVLFLLALWIGRKTDIPS